MTTGIRLSLTLLAGLLLLSPGADAARKKKKTGTRSPHHCVKGGAEVAGAHKRDCRAQGGKWLKVKPAGAAAKP